MLKSPIFTSIHIIFSSIFESAILAKTGEEIQLFYVFTFESHDNETEFDCGEGFCLDVNAKCDGFQNCPNREMFSKLSQS